MNRVGKIGALRTLVALKRQERMTREQVVESQEHRLRQTLRRADRLPYFRDLFQRHEVDPDTCSLSDLGRLPVLTKDAYRDHLAGTVGRSEPDRGIWHLYTAGSTGIPFTIPMGGKEGIVAQTLFRYACLKSGLRPADILCYISIEPENLKPGTFFQKLGIGRQYNLDLRDDIAQVVDALRRVRPRVLYSFPSYFALLGRYLQERQIALPSVRLILTGGEVLTAETRELLTTAFGAQVRDHYGSTEFSRLAYECNHGRLHTIPYAAIIEVIDQDADGIGEAVITSLYHQVTPFVRYRIGDRIKVVQTDCPCGVPFSVIDYIQGRSNDFFVLPSGRRISWRSVVRFRDVPGMLQYQIVQKKPDYFEVRIQKNDRFTPISAELVREAIRSGCHGEDVEVAIVFSESLDRGRTGKLQAAICEVDLDGAGTS